MTTVTALLNAFERHHKIRSDLVTSSSFPYAPSRFHVKSISDTSPERFYLSLLQSSLFRFHVTPLLTMTSCEIRRQIPIFPTNLIKCVFILLFMNIIISMNSQIFESSSFLHELYFFYQHMNWSISYIFFYPIHLERSLTNARTIASPIYRNTPDVLVKRNIRRISTSMQ